MSEFKNFREWAHEKGHYQTINALDSYTKLTESRGHAMKEQDYQKKILEYLEARGFVTVKVIVANKAGILDIIGCDTNGRYWEIEVKTPTGRASKLQKKRHEKLKANNAITFFAYGYDEFVAKYMLAMQQYD